MYNLKLIALLYLIGWFSTLFLFVRFLKPPRFLISVVFAYYLISLWYLELFEMYFCYDLWYIKWQIKIRDMMKDKI